MIRFRIRELAEKKGLKTAYQLQMAMNLPAATASRWWNKDRLKHIESDSLERLCEYLECEPGDIIVRVQDEQTARPSSGRRAAQ